MLGIINMETHMNTIQRVVLATGMLIVALSILFPPWVYTFQIQGIKQVTIPAGYYSIFSPPPPRQAGYLHGVRVDHSRLIIQTIAIISGTIAALVVLNRVQR